MDKKLSILLKIKIFSLFLFFAAACAAQSEKYLIPFSNNLLLNPSFAGLDENTNVWTGFQFNSFSEQKISNQYSLTYDYYSEKLEGGVAFYFQQELIGRLNINTVETGFTLNRQYKVNKGYFIPSLNINLQLANKQWYVQFIDQMLNKQFTPPSAPGYDFARYARIKPRAGIMWSSDFYKLGVSALVPIGKKITDEESEVSLNDPVLVFHVSRLSGGRKRGLVSKPYKSRPRIIVLYSKDAVISRAELNFEEVYQTYSFFVQNNFTGNQHAVGGSYGWKLENLRLNLAAGMRLPYISENVSFFGEISLQVVIPPFYYSEKNPWRPKKKLF